MAIVVKDRVKVTFTTTGTADFTLGSATLGFQSFAAIGNGNQTYYAAVDAITGDWEVGYGTYTTAGPTLTRTAVLSSSAAGAKVSFGAGSKDVFCTYPSEKAIYEETSGEVLFDGGPITIIGTGVTSYTSFTNFFAEMFGNANTYVQTYIQNQNSGADASADYVALNDIGTDSTYYVDMGMNSSGFTSGTYQIYTPNSGYVYSIGGGTTSKMFVGSGDDDLILHAGGFATTNIGLTILGTDQTVVVAKDATVGGTLSVTGAADFGSTVLLAANPTTALQAATKQYVDNQVTAGLHIHDPVLVETTANLTATYANGGTNANIIQIANGTDITFFSATPAVGDQFYIGSSSNGLLANTAYFVVNIVTAGTVQASLTFGGAIVTGLTNGSPTIPSLINSGVGATLTNSGTQAALTIDNVALALTNRVMVRLQTNAAENGVYTVTTVGTGATNWVLTRATDSDRVNPADPNGVGTGDYYFTQDGDLNAGDSHVLTTEPNTMILGYTALTYTQFSGGVTYTGVAPIDVTGQTISLTGTVAATNGGTGVNTVTTGDLLYGSATNTWSKLPVGAAYKALVVNAGGTQVEWNAVALNQSAAVSGSLGATNGGTGLNTYTLGDLLYSSAANTLAKLAGNTTTTKKFLAQTGTGAVSAAPAWLQPAATDITGLAASATTDTTNAANITSGTLPSGRISGSYTGLTGTGALTAGSLGTGFTTVAAARGGTGQSSYAIGDLLYASTSTALSKLADVAVGNALISGGVGAAPSWGKIGLATHVSGTLPVANGGTGVTSSTGTGSVVLSDSPTLVTPNLGTPASGTLTNCTFPTLNQNTTGTASNVTGVVAVLNGGTGSSTAGGALTNLGAYAATNPAGYTTNTGTVTSVAGTGTVSGISLSGTVTTAGSLTLGGTLAVTASNFASQTANTFLAAPNGAAGVPTFRAVAAADIPTLNQNTTGSSASCTGNAATATTATTATTANALATGNNYQVNSLGVGTAGSGTAGEIRATNNITAYYSDDRFKTNLGNIPDALAKVLTLNGFYYEANELAQSYGYEKKLEVGVSAQQVQAVQPEVVAPAPIDENYLTVRYERLVPLLIEAIKELNAKVTALEQVVAKST